MQRALEDPKSSTKESTVLSRGKTEGAKEETSFIFNKQYKTCAKIHSSSSVDIYLGVNLANKQQIAIKTEKSKAKDQILQIEARTLNSLRVKENEDAPGIPKLLWFGTEEHNNDHLNILVMELTGPSLGILLQTRTQKFSLKTTLMLADQMIKRIEFMHSRGFLHRDIKPHNFAIGLMEKSDTVYLVNFSSAKQFKNAKTGAHKTYAENKDLVGSANFTSINCHMGIEPSRRDDLESLGYTLVYLVKGSLPWQGTQGNSLHEKIAKIMDKKISIPPELLCKGLPDTFSTFLNYCRGLKYDEKPDYKYLRDIFRRTMAEKEYTYDTIFDWVNDSMYAENKIYEYGDMSISFKRPTSVTGESSLSFSGNQPLERSRILGARRIETDLFSQQSDEASLGLPGDVSISSNYDKSFPSKTSIMPMTNHPKTKNDKVTHRSYTEGSEESKSVQEERFRAYLELRSKVKTYDYKSFDDEKRFLYMGTDSTTNKTISLKIPEFGENKDRTTVCNVILTEDEDELDDSDSGFEERESDKETTFHQVSMTQIIKDQIQLKNPTLDRNKTLARGYTMGKPLHEQKQTKIGARVHTLYSKDSDNQAFESEYHPSIDSRESRDLESEPKRTSDEDEKKCSMF